jgi:sugar lactone lactonase YvrE
MITRNTILFLTCIIFTALACVFQATADVEAESVAAEKLIDAAGPEDIAFDADGRIYISTADGIMRLQPDGSQLELFAQTPTHPLGLHFDADGNLIVCDGELYSVAPDGTVTMLTNKVDDSQIILANGLDIAADGTIYFADSCFYFTRDEVGKEFENPGPHGRLLAYEPTTGTTRLVLGDLWFANGVAVSPDQSFVLVAESLGSRVMRYWLTGDKQGQSEVFIENVMGVDNLDVNPRGMFWIPSSAEGILLEVDTDGNVVRRLDVLHPSGEPYLSLAGAREHEGLLYLNSYDYVALERINLFLFPRPEDFTNVFFMSLDPGLNMISIPLKPVTQYTARSLAERLSATVVIKYDTALGRFVGFTPDANGNGFPIEGGQGYIINTPEGGVFPFVGAAWTNEPEAEMAPPATQTHSAWAFVVSGSVGARDSSYTVTVRNLRTGAVAMDIVDSSGYFAAAYADLSRQAVVEAGDRIEVTVKDSSGQVVSGPHVQDVTLEGIRNAVLSVRLRMGHVIPEKSSPETWIPFQLRESDSVFIRIYDSSGRLIRNLALGYRDAGIYVSRSRAAYWDGKNEAGEESASGIYFYTITAGDFSATRKMTVKK